MISVLISTRNRPKKTLVCLSSILKNSYKNFKIILIDQSTNKKTKEIVGKIKTKKIKYIKLSNKGKSKALNLALRKASGRILAFTDDDCIVDKNWLKNINEFFIKNKNTVGVFGKTLPFKPGKHIKQVCPATFELDEKRIVNSSNINHYKELGIGNNMSLRKSIFNKVGCFREWLGVGSISMAGGIESELIYRILRKRYKLAFVPNIIVYHNRWLNYNQERIIQGKYTCGLMAFYFYYLFKKEKIMAKFIIGRIKERIIKRLIRFLRKIKNLDSKYIYLNKEEPFFIIWETICVMKGFLIAVYFSLLIRQENEATVPK